MDGIVGCSVVDPDVMQLKSSVKASCVNFFSVLKATLLPLSE